MKGLDAQFVWGIATSAYQIEGAIDRDGKGPSIWDDFCARPGTIVDGSSGRTACSHYDERGRDLELLRWLGVDAYRFSIAWSRIFPQGSGRLEQRGLDHYSRWVDELLEAGIDPVVTLYHWDLPSAIEAKGGWRNRDTAKRFIDYALTVMQRLGDRVTRVMTHNEPWCAAMLGHWEGTHAPGLKDPAAAVCSAHHLLLSHGWAVQALRSELRSTTELGIALNPAPIYPHRDCEADHDAARAADGTRNRLWLDPLYARGYPKDVIEDLRKLGAWPEGRPSWLHDGDEDDIAAPCDFLAINYYNPVRVSATAGIDTLPADAPTSDLGWEIEADGLRDLLSRLHRDYRPKQLVISENGAADNSEPMPMPARSGAHSSGQSRLIDDHMRCDYLLEHLHAVAEARAAGVPVSAYYAWTLCDNFEWAEGYSARFGMVWFDQAVRERVKKRSAYLYRSTIDAARRG